MQTVIGAEKLSCCQKQRDKITKLCVNLQTVGWHNWCICNIFTESNTSFNGFVLKKKSSSRVSFVCINLNSWILSLSWMCTTLKGTSVCLRSILTLRWKLWNLNRSRPLHQTLQPGWWSEGESVTVGELRFSSKTKYLALGYSASQVYISLLPACSFMPTECCYEFWDIEFYQGMVFQGL